MLSNNGTVIMRIAIFLLSVLCLGGASLPAQSAVFGSQGCGEVACDGMGSNYDLATKANACASSAFNLSGQIFDDRSLDSGGCLQVKGSYSSPAQNTTTTQSAPTQKDPYKMFDYGPNTNDSYNPAPQNAPSSGGVGLRPQCCVIKNNNSCRLICQLVS